MEQSRSPAMRAADGDITKQELAAARGRGSRGEAVVVARRAWFENKRARGYLQFD
jgi:hypothetical protein